LLAKFENVMQDYISPILKRELPDHYCKKIS
jgi:hypothetical protein